MSNSNSNPEVHYPKSLLIEFAHFLVPEIKKFYESEEGKKYYENWLKEHPEYKDKV